MFVQLAGQLRGARPYPCGQLLDKRADVIDNRIDILAGILDDRAGGRPGRVRARRSGRNHVESSASARPASRQRRSATRA